MVSRSENLLPVFHGETNHKPTIGCWVPKAHKANEACLVRTDGKNSLEASKMFNFGNVTNVAQPTLAM